MLNYKPAELLSFLKSYLSDITGESLSRKNLKKMNQVANDTDYSLLRISNKIAVNALIGNLCELQSISIQKSQALVRHAPEDVQLMLYDRFLCIFNSLGKMDPSLSISFKDGLSELLNFCLIEAWESGLQETQ